MKKLVAITAILLGLSMTSFAQGGLFHRGASAEGETTDYSLSKGGSRTETPIPMLPSHNGSNESQPATPVGSGIAVLMGFGAAYLVGKRRREE
jgi:hypothetical protein